MFSGNFNKIQEMFSLYYTYLVTSYVGLRFIYALVLYEPGTNNIGLDAQSPKYFVRASYYDRLDNIMCVMFECVFLY